MLISRTDKTDPRRVRIAGLAQLEANHYYCAHDVTPYRRRWRTITVQHPEGWVLREFVVLTCCPGGRLVADAKEAVDHVQVQHGRVFESPHRPAAQRVADMPRRLVDVFEPAREEVVRVRDNEPRPCDLDAGRIAYGYGSHTCSLVPAIRHDLGWVYAGTHAEEYSVLHRANRRVARTELRQAVAEFNATGETDIEPVDVPRWTW